MKVVEGRAWVKGLGLTQCCVAWEGEHISKIAKVLKGEEAHLRLRHDRLLLPGAIDLHVHFREPGATHKEDFATGTAGAACGGVTTVVDMPNNRPPTDTPGRFQDKLEQVRAKARIDFGLYGLGRPDTPRQERFPAFDETVTAWKVYPYGLSPTEYRATVAGLLEKGTRLVAVHAEHPEMLGLGLRVRRLEDHTEHRSGAETAALELLAGLGSERLHLAHLSSAGSLRLLYPKKEEPDDEHKREAGPRKELESGSSAPVVPRPRQATSEVTPHHLLLAAKMEKLGLLGKCDPPLRRRSDNAALWRALRAGHIDCVASDHAPHTLEEKEGQTPLSGLPGVETMVPLMLQAVRDRRWELGRAVEALCEAPARRLGLDRVKGLLAAGAHADLMVVDLKHPVKIRAERLHSRCGWSPFEGWPGCFPEAVWSRGEPVAEERECVVRGGHGRYVNHFR